jgi:hypothetical protein
MEDPVTQKNITSNTIGIMYLQKISNNTINTVFLINLITPAS